jgi:hypothetical protein
MKLLLFISFIGFSLTLFAQISKEDLQKKFEDAIKNRNPTDKTFSLPQFPLIKQEQKTLQGYINGQQVTAGIYNLSLDGMPCVVPDTNEIQQCQMFFQMYLCLLKLLSQMRRLCSLCSIPTENGVNKKVKSFCS